MADVQAVASAPVAQPDPYSDLAKADRVWLKRAAASLRAHLGRTVREVVNCGETLRRARRRLGRDRWRPYYALSLTPVTPRAAELLGRDQENE